jgi:Resolvase, N terminal domain
MLEPLRHRQTKGAETDMPGLPQPRHIPTLPAAGMLLGYARVSKENDQTNLLQAKALRTAGCRRIFEEAASGGRWDRPELHRMLDSCARVMLSLSGSSTACRGR